MLCLRITVLASLACGAVASNPPIAGYEPQTSVTDHAGISGDQAVIEKFVGFDDSDSFAIAKKVYEEGGHSKSFAEITLVAPLENTVPKGTPITGTTDADPPAIVNGKAMEDFAVGATVIKMQYLTSDSIDEYVLCKVGGLPPTEQVTSGCIKAEDGVIEIASANLDYETAVNKNGRTIQGFSTGANKKFKFNEDTDADYYPFFQKFVDYYGSFDFGDKICTAGFDGSQATLTNGSINLAGYTFEGRSQIAKKCTAFINTLLYSQREMFDAIDDCNRGCTTAECNDDAVHALDEAVAFYVGNQHAADPKGLGNLGFALAEKRGANFATMTGADFISGQSKVNEAIMREFGVLKGQFINTQCAEAEVGIAEVVRLMQIPLIQGTLRYAHRTSTNPTPTEAMQTEGAIFAAGILPIVHACDSEAADTIYNNMRLKPDRSTRADFSAVKSAFEDVYSCMGLTCADVGGLIDEANEGFYVQGGEPCDGAAVLQVAAGSGGSMAFLSFMGVSIASVAALFM